MSRSYEHGGNVFDIARQLGRPASQLIDFSASINPLGISSHVKDAIIGALDSLVHYPDNSHSQLKQALAVRHGLSPANIVVANGSTEIIYHLPAMLPGKRALIVCPSFNEYLRSLGQQGWQIHHFILQAGSNFALDLAALERALADGYDALYLCNPGNPNGTLYSRQTIQRVYNLCSASGTFLVLDEAFMDFCEDGSARPAILTRDNGIILRSMTKFFAIPGLRLGYALSSPATAERLAAMGGPWSVNTLALTAGVAALEDHEHNRRTLAYVRQERHNLCQHLAEFGQLRVYPSSVNFLLVEILEGMSAGELREHLLHEGLLIRDCSNFVGLSPRFFRIAVRTAGENQRLMEELKRILK